VAEKRSTIQRAKILEYIRGVKTHPNAETVYAQVKKEVPTISLSTVYRNINILADDGQITRLEVNNESRFDADTTCHQHCICTSCGQITDVFQNDISEYAMKNIKTKNFTPSCVKIIYYGECKCEKNDKN